MALISVVECKVFSKVIHESCITKGKTQHFSEVVVVQSRFIAS